jgi:hypothetical protein
MSSPAVEGGGGDIETDRGTIGYGVLCGSGRRFNDVGEWEWRYDRE